MAFKLGLALPQMAQYNIGRDVPLVARAAEATGYESVYVFERTLAPQDQSGAHGLYTVPGLPWPEHYRKVADPLVTLTLAGAVTQRVKLGTSVLVAGYHGSFELARSYASLDNATGGRVVLGLGTGWSSDEYDAASVVPIAKRGAALDELLGVTAAVWGPDPVSYQGQWTTIAPAEVGPKPASPIPVFLAATNQPSFRRVAERADGWMPIAGAPDQLAGQYQTLQELAAASGRTRPVRAIGRANATYSAKPFEGEGRQPFQGSVEQIVEDLAAHSGLDWMEEILIDLTSTVWDAQELADVAAEIFTAARSAGV